MVSSAPHGLSSPEAQEHAASLLSRQSRERERTLVFMEEQEIQRTMTSTTATVSTGCPFGIADILTVGRRIWPGKMDGRA